MTKVAEHKWFGAYLAKASYRISPRMMEQLVKLNADMIDAHQCLTSCEVNHADEYDSVVSFKINGTNCDGRRF